MPSDNGPTVIDDRVTWHLAGAREPLTIELSDLFAQALDD